MQEIQQINEDYLSDAWIKSVETMGRESDRGLLLVGLSWIDDSIEKLLRSYLTNAGEVDDVNWLLDPRPGNRPLASLAVRTRLANCLGLLERPVRKTIDELRGVRNVNAHGMSPFTITQDIADRITRHFHENWRKMFPTDSASLLEQMPWLSGPRGKVFWAINFVGIRVGYTAHCLSQGLLRIKFKVPFAAVDEPAKPSVG